MSLSIAIDQLRASGWSTLDSRGCAFDTRGREYPALARVKREFAQVGFDLEIQRIEQFNCFKATWSEAGSTDASGSTVSLSEAEAAVFALAQMRRGLVGVTA